MEKTQIGDFEKREDVGMSEIIKGGDPISKILDSIIKIPNVVDILFVYLDSEDKVEAIVTSKEISKLIKAIQIAGSIDTTKKWEDIKAETIDWSFTSALPLLKTSTVKEVLTLFAVDRSLDTAVIVDDDKKLIGKVTRKRFFDQLKDTYK